jgi:hypothetical protein
MSIDNWRHDLKTLAPNNILLDIRPPDVSIRLNPVLYGIVRASTRLLGSFSQIGDNYLRSQFVDNPAFQRGPLDNAPIDCAFFGATFYNRFKASLRGLTFEQCYNGGRYLSIEEYSGLGIIIAISVWMRLNLALSYNHRKYSVNVPQQERSTFQEFFSRVKKGSRKFRLILCSQSINNINIGSSGTVTTFARNIETTAPEVEILKKCADSWKLSFLPNDLREFLFVERNNFLKIGVRTVHYIQNATDRCSLCRIINPDTAYRETTQHLFLTCPVSRNLLRGLTRTIGLRHGLDDPDFRSKFWYGVNNARFDLSLFILFGVIRHTIWKFKLRRTIPTQHAFSSVVCSYLRMVRYVRPLFFDTIKAHFDNDLF